MIKDNFSIDISILSFGDFLAICKVLTDLGFIKNDKMIRSSKFINVRKESLNFEKRFYFSDYNLGIIKNKYYLLGLRK